MARQTGIRLPQDFKFDMKVHFFDNVLVNCKGQLWKNGTAVKGLQYFGVKFNRGSCMQGSKDKLAGPAPGHEGSLDTVIVLTQPQWGAFYHYLIDSLPRWFHVKEQYPKLASDPAVKLHAGWVTEGAQAWARLIGIDTEAGPGSRLIAGNWIVKRAVWPPSQIMTFRQPGNGMLPDATSKMHEKLLLVAPKLAKSLLGWQQEDGRKTMLLLRRRGHRVQKNFDEMADLMRERLESKGWTINIWDEKALPGPAEGCAMFHRADVIMGFHGAGMAHLVCARAGSHLIEFQQLYHSPDFEQMAGRFGIFYHGIHTDTKLREVKPKDVNMTLIQAAVTETLDMMKPGQPPVFVPKMMSDAEASLKSLFQAGKRVEPKNMGKEKIARVARQKAEYESRMKLKAERKALAASAKGDPALRKVKPGSKAWAAYWARKNVTGAAASKLEDADAEEAKELERAEQARVTAAEAMEEERVRQHQVEKRRRMDEAAARKHREKLARQATAKSKAEA